ncbi:MAG: DUF5591 domain-containing protein [Candidatus Diapherotrites archaeon]|nr:DUF5591 domain-containing protein [Candidatus Diapherotrites archaeon]
MKITTKFLDGAKICSIATEKGTLASPCVLSEKDLKEKLGVKTSKTPVLSNQFFPVQFGIEEKQKAALEKEQKKNKGTGQEVLFTGSTQNHALLLESQTITIANASMQLNHPREFFSNLRKLREKNPCAVIYAAGPMHTSNIPLLCYCGATAFDETTFKLATAAGKKITFFGFENTPPEKNKKELLKENQNEFLSEIFRVKKMTIAGRMFDYAESRSLLFPHLSSAFTILTREFPDLIGSVTPVAKKTKNLCGSFNSFFKPEIHGFVKKIAERYNRPKSKKIALLLPCSFTTPYSRSPSHKKIISQLKQHLGKKRNLVHEITISSPVGVVPRETEHIYPASNYDTATSGIWSDDEVREISSLLKKFLEKQKYEKIFALLKNDGYIRIAKATGLDITFVDSIEGKISGLVSKMNREKYGFELEKARATLNHQFGGSAGDILSDRARVKEGPKNIKVFDPKHIATFNEFGTLSLSLEGGKRIFEKKRYIVEIEAVFSGNNMFAAGVKNADENILPGDEIVAACNNKYMGVGKAKMSGKDMTASKTGLAFEFRHKQK